MAKHTPGPWVALPSWTRFHGTKPIFDNGLWHILPADNVERLPIASVDHGDDHDAPTREQAEHDARRIVAAVNAVEGVSTEALEAGVVKDLLEALRMQQGACCGVVDTPPCQWCRRSLAVIDKATREGVA